MSSRFKRIAIIGLGQMGASLAFAIRRAAPDIFLAGYDLNPTYSSYMLTQGGIQLAASSIAQALEGADLAILCTPVGSYATIAQEIATHAPAKMLLTDIGSVKEQAIQDVLQNIPQPAAFIPSHPLAGSEKTGPETATADLFTGKLFVITPTTHNSDNDVQSIRELWEIIGSTVRLMPADLHDKIYAYVSHLPQLMAYGFAKLYDAQHITAGAEDAVLQRFIRIGRSDPLMWRDVFIENQENVVEALSHTQEILRHFAQELQSQPSKSEPNPDIVYKNLLPRLIASALIMTVKLLEQQVNMNLASYAARGFHDFTFPATAEPGGDIRTISDYASQVAEALEAFIASTSAIQSAIIDDNKSSLLDVLQACQQAGTQMLQTQAKN